MKTNIYIYLLVAGLLFPQLIFGQWQHLGNGFVLPASTKSGISTISVVDTNIIWTRALLPVAVFSRTEDGGDTWLSGTITSTPNYYTDNLYALNGDTAWYCLSLTSSDLRSKIFRTHDGGYTWTEQTGPFNNLRHAVKQLYFFDKNVGIAYGNSNSTSPNLDTLRIYRTTNGGATWTRIHPATLPPLLSGEKIITSGLNPRSGNNHYDVKGDTLWFGTSLGRVWRTTNQGQNWTVYAVGGTLGCTALVSVQFSNHLRGIAVPCDGPIALRTTNGGQTWSTFSLPFPARFIEYIPGTTGSYILAPTYATQSDLSITHDEGLTWEKLNFSYPHYMFSTIFLSPTRGYGGSFIVSPDSGGVFEWIGDLNAGNPDCSACSKVIEDFPHTEGFEDNGGDWCESGGDDINWIVNTKTTVTANTGPSWAATDNYFMYIEGSFPNNPTRTADLISPCYKLSTGCFSSAKFEFSYHMYGSTMGSLHIAVSTDSGQTWSTPIWSKTGNQGNAWHSDSVILSSYLGQTIRLRISGTTGSGEFSDIAIDELVFSTRPRLRIAATVSDVACHGDSSGNILASGINGTPPYAYFWSTGDTTALLGNVPPGSYTVTVIDSNECISQNTYTIQEPPVLQLTTHTTHVSCFGNANGSAQATVTGGTPPYSYLWSNGGTTASITNLSPANYLLILRDANTCTKIDSFQITEPPQLLANEVISDVSCPGDSNGTITLNPSGGMPPYLVNWSIGSLGTSLSNLKPGSYSFFLTDNTNCVIGQTLSVGEPDSVSGLFAVTDVKCYGDFSGNITVSPSGGNGGYTYSWSTGDQSDSITDLGLGTYSVQITDSLGCSWEGTAQVTQPDSLSLSKVVRHDSTGTGVGLIDLKVTGGTPPYTYEWDTGETTRFLIKLKGDSTYFVDITDANGCMISDSTFIKGKEVIDVLGDRISSSLIKLFPNPTKDELTIHIKAHWTSTITIRIFDLYGRQLLLTNEYLAGQEKRISLDVGSLPAGIYYLQVQTERGRHTSGFVKK